jgi:hypothetical protein
MLLAECDHPAVSLAAELRFEAAWLVVNARMNDSAVPSGLMAGPAIFFFDHREADLMVSFQNGPSHGQPNDASTDHDVIEFMHLRPESAVEVAWRFWAIIRGKGRDAKRGGFAYFLLRQRTRPQRRLEGEKRLIPDLLWSVRDKEGEGCIRPGRVHSPKEGRSNAMLDSDRPVLDVHT